LSIPRLISHRLTSAKMISYAGALEVISRLPHNAANSGERSESGSRRLRTALPC
jgi:hypothetical protein